MSCAATQQLCVVQGSTSLHTLTVYEDGEPKVLASPQAAGDEVYLTVIDTENSNTAVIELVSTDLAEIEKAEPQTGDDIGKVYIKFAPSDTSSLSISSTRYKYDVWVKIAATDQRFQVVALSPFVVVQRATVIP